MSLGSLPVNFETFSMDRSQELKFLLNSCMCMSLGHSFSNFIEHCHCTLYNEFVILYQTSSEWEAMSAVCQY